MRIEKKLRRRFRQHSTIMGQVLSLQKLFLSVKSSAQDSKARSALVLLEARHLVINFESNIFQFRGFFESLSSSSTRTKFRQRENLVPGCLKTEQVFLLFFLRGKIRQEWSSGDSHVEFFLEKAKTFFKRGQRISLAEEFPEFRGILHILLAPIGYVNLQEKPLNFKCLYRCSNEQEFGITSGFIQKMQLFTNIELKKSPTVNKFVGWLIKQ